MCSIPNQDVYMSTTPRYIVWHDSYNIGVHAIDVQHRRLIGLINALYMQVHNVRTPAMSWLLLQEFNQYAESHFHTEERIARSALTDEAYLLDHESLHEKYRATLIRFKDEIEAGNQDALLGLLRYLSTWWENHILHEDRELGQRIVANYRTFGLHKSQIDQPTPGNS